MTSEVRFNEQLRIIEIIHTGILDSENLQKTTDDGVVLVRTKRVSRILIDTSDLDSVERIVDLYNLPDKYVESGLSQQVSIALVSPKSAAAQEASKFYSNVCFNRGWLVRPFAERDAAVEWLTSENPT